MDAQGLTNTPNFNAPATNLSNPATFGVINGAGGNRSMQGVVRLYFWRHRPAHDLIIEFDGIPTPV